MEHAASLRHVLGAAVHELPVFLWGMRPPRVRGGRAAPWLFVCNRRERLDVSPEGDGVRCSWRWMSELTVTRVFPSSGRRLLRRALRDWPIALGEAPESERESPRITFIVGHRGRARLPLLRRTLQSIAAQRGAPLECLVVEQSERCEIRGSLPSWVRYVHAPPPDAGAAYSRARAFNDGAAAARGDLLVFHDGDLLAPRDYAAELLRIYDQGFEAIDLKRFVFCLTPACSEAIVPSALSHPLDAPERVLQNAAGGSVAVARSAFDAIGGFDESFVGWGGEDDEFWERALTRRAWAYGYLPMVHLWHAPQAEKASGGNGRYWDLVRVPPRDRIAHLVAGRAAARRAGAAEHVRP